MTRIIRNLVDKKIKIIDKKRRMKKLSERDKTKSAVEYNIFDYNLYMLLSEYLL